MSGPFNTFDARFRMQQKLLDFSDFEKFQASRMGVLIAKYEEKFSRQKVVFLTAVAYLEGLRALSELKAAVADMELAERLFAQARRQQEVGIATGVEVARSETRVAQNKLRHEKAQMDVHNALIGLQRVTGLPYDTSLRLKNSLFFIAEPVQSADSAVTTAESTRMEMQIANDRVRMTHYQLNAARAERLPTISFDGGVGLSGLGMDETARLVGDAVFFVRVPIFEGGQIAGAVKESKSVYRQQKISYEDLKRQVGEDVHMALWAMDTRVEQVRAAAKVYELARRELQLAGNRFKQGVGDNVEVVNAQTALTNARDEYISALNDYHNTRMNLYFALGQVESFYLQKSE
jgi:outer membrane protein TolC